jgi:3-deoxy-manno-octulosonate cytidylyltransferase (CMP-KDO synthetase)
VNYILIPARLESKRFPRKVIEPIDGWPMLYHTYHQCKKSKGFDRVLPLIDKRPTEHICQIYRMPYAWTEYTCKNGTERCAEYASRTYKDDDLVINVQADEPMMDPKIPEMLLERLKEKPDMVWTAARKLRDTVEMVSMECVKCFVIDETVQEFSRLYIPGFDWAHIGVYGFSVRRLKDYLERRQTPSEIQDGLEQLRWNEPLGCIEVEYDGMGVDLPEHAKLVEEKLQKQHESVALFWEGPE